MNTELILPKVNSFIPSHFDTDSVKAVEPVSHPWIILDTEVIRLWHKMDDTFLTPKGNVNFEIKSPLAYESVKSSLLTRLYTELLKECLNEYSYYAEVAGLAYNLDNSTSGISLTICTLFVDSRWLQG